MEMKVGIGLPNPVSGYKPFPGTRLVEWARRAEDRGFSGLATIDRLVYGNYDSLATLAAAAGATSRIGLLSNILLGPIYPTPLLAKTAASIDQISGGRLTLGVAPGGREDDYAGVGVDFETRGKEFDHQLELLHALWRGEGVTEAGPAITPRPTSGDRVPVLIGGNGGPALRRGVRWAEGFTIGGAPADQAAGIVQMFRQAWAEGGREGEPRIAALAYFSLGQDADEDSRGYLRSYYGFLGGFGEVIAQGALRSEDAIREAKQKFADAGISELYFDPTTSELDQIDRLADVVL
jgi:alkanesulfonate monooxygenase SsuD/methylene tetrahydromethanopterin reductase-like flavin-dependent oxidoreductase (luciferase family)